MTISLSPGVEFHQIWGADVTPVLPNPESTPPTASYFPPAGGFRVSFALFPVDPAPPPADLDMAAAVAEVEQRLPGMLAHMEPDNPGMHTTDTVDVDIVLAGEMVLELDNGAETVLRAGDIVVQHGTRHRWHNRGPVPAVLAAFLVGAQRNATS